MSKTPLVGSAIYSLVRDGVEIGPQAGGIDPRCSSGGFGDRRPRHESTGWDRPQFRVTTSVWPERTSRSTAPDSFLSSLCVIILLMRNCSTCSIS